MTVSTTTTNAFPFVTTKPLGTLEQGVELHRLLLDGKESGLEGIKLPKGEWRVRKVGNVQLNKAKAQVNGETVWGYVAVKAMLAKAHDCTVSLGSQAKSVGATKNDGVTPDGAIVRPATQTTQDASHGLPVGANGSITEPELSKEWTKAEMDAVGKAQLALEKAVDKANKAVLARKAKREATPPPAGDSILATLSPEQISALSIEQLRVIMGK